jgi:hypothetical protein
MKKTYLIAPVVLAMMFLITLSPKTFAAGPGGVQPPMGAPSPAPQPSPGGGDGYSGSGSDDTATELLFVDGEVTDNPEFPDTVTCDTNRGFTADVQVEPYATPVRGVQGKYSTTLVVNKIIAQKLIGRQGIITHVLYNACVFPNWGVGKNFRTDPPNYGGVMSGQIYRDRFGILRLRLDAVANMQKPTGTAVPAF